jgi:hypothetical protein
MKQPPHRIIRNLPMHFTILVPPAPQSCSWAWLHCAKLTHMLAVMHDWDECCIV